MVDGNLEQYYLHITVPAHKRVTKATDKKNNKRKCSPENLLCRRESIKLIWAFHHVS